MNTLYAIAYRVLIVYPTMLDQFAKVCYWLVGVVGWLMIILVCRKELRGAKETQMRTFLFALSILAMTAAPSKADPFNSGATVIRSSITIPVVMVSSYTPTLVDTQMDSSFVVEVQNRDASAAICCAFDAAFSTVTTSAQAKGCRQIGANGGSWSISRWFQNLKVYCQTLGTSGPSPVTFTQGK